MSASASGKYYPMRPADVPLGLEDFYPDPHTVPVAEFLPGLKDRRAD